MNTFYLCDGDVPECKKRGCYKNGGECHHTSHQIHAVNREHEFRTAFNGDLWEIDAEEIKNETLES